MILAIIYTLIHLSGYPTYLFTPDSASAATRVPAVLVMHDHGAYYEIGRQKMADPVHFDADSTSLACSRYWTHRLYDDMYLADSLAEMGYMVLVTDCPGWGSQRPRPERWDSAIVAYDRLAMDYLYSRPEVDTTRIATFGFSMGGYRAWMLAAADRRVSACAAFHWMTSAPQRPGWCLPLDYAAVASGVAPRPFLLVAGDHDHLFPIEDVRLQAKRIAERYRAQSGGHQQADTTGLGEHEFRCGAFQYRELPLDHVFTHRSYLLLRSFFLR